MSAEVWAQISGYEGLYEVSDYGRVRSFHRREPVILKQSKADGYLHVNLYLNGQGTTTTVHCLVLETFVSPRPDGLVTRHLDNNRGNNRRGNLAWGTQAENVMDQVVAGTHRQTRKETCPQGHPFDEQNTYRRPDGRNERGCKACRRASNAARKLRRYTLAV